MKLIPLTQGLFAQVDDEDYDQLNQFNWFAEKSRKTFYAKRNIPHSTGRQTTVKMHVVIMGKCPGRETHHKNENGLDNRRENLQLVSLPEHKQLLGRQANNVSGFRGVCFHVQFRRWHSYITHLGHRKHLGSYDTAVAAAHVRDTEARKLGWPEIGMNFPL